MKLATLLLIFSMAAFMWPTLSSGAGPANNCWDTPSYACYDCPTITSYYCLSDPNGLYTSCTVIPFVPDCPEGTCYTAHFSATPGSCGYP
jgi:hypothetical protein